ncbi:MAG: DUF6226 family protein [Dermabacteraceae bacterium]|uniref:DUF6226 family protein n=1 Tax=Brachybacterium sp. TaxID=1891286 RepID=UPI003F8F624A
MTAFPARTWWQEHHTFLQQLAEDGEVQAGPPFSPQLLDLLADVERAFAVTGADTPPWPDPHLGPGGREVPVREEEYSRCLDPGKHRILGARAEAWALVLTERGWAEREEIIDGAALPWLIAPHARTHRTTALWPHRPGAQAVLLVRTAPDDGEGDRDLEPADALLPGIVVGLGDPPLPVETIPVCGCDACDSGSRDLLEQLDQAVLSIVDGSYEVEISPRGRSERSSFGASAGSGSDDPAVTVRIAAGPWAPDWTPRPMDPMLDLDVQSDPWTEEMLHEPWPSRLLDAVIWAFPVPFARRLDALRPGRAATVTSRAYVALEADACMSLDSTAEALREVGAGACRRRAREPGAAGDAGGGRTRRGLSALRRGEGRARHARRAAPVRDG